MGISHFADNALEGVNLPEAEEEFVKMFSNQCGNSDTAKQPTFMIGKASGRNQVKIRLALIKLCIL